MEVPGERFRFAHALVRATLYDELSGPRRVALHRRVAEAIEAIHADALDPHLPNLSHHWARAAAPAALTGRALDYAARAGDLALAQLAHDEAVTYYRSALELLAAAPPDDARRLALLISLATPRSGPASRNTGGRCSRPEPLRNGSAMPTRWLAPRSGNCRGAFVSTIGVLDAERVAVLRAALDAVGDEESPRRARLLAYLGIELIAAEDRPGRLRLSDEALALARRLGDLRTLADVLSARVYTIQAPDTLTERLAITAELVDIAARLEDPVVRFQATFLRVRSLLEIGDTDETDRCVVLLDHLAAELGQHELRWFAGWIRVGRLLCAGRLGEADRLSREGLELGQVDAPQIFATQQFSLLLDAGHVSEAEKTLLDLSARAPRIVLVRLFLAELYCELERYDEGRAIFEPLAANGFADVPQDWMWIRSIALCGSLSVELGDAVSAAKLYEMLLPYEEQVLVTGGISGGAVAHYLGILSATLGRCDQAEVHFAAAEAIHERIGGLSWLARGRLEWARMLLIHGEPGDAGRARALLGQVVAMAQASGFAAIERRAAALLERSG